MSGGETVGRQEVLTVVPSRRALLMSAPVIGWCLVALVVLLLGVLLALGIESTAGSVVALVGSAVVAATVLVVSRHLILQRLRPWFTVRGVLLGDRSGREIDLTEMDGIQTWVDEYDTGEVASFYFALIPRGVAARVDPKAVTAGVLGRHNLSVPAELESHVFCYQSQLRPRLHVFTAELQRRAPHLFLDHVGYM